MPHPPRPGSCGLRGTALHSPGSWPPPSSCFLTGRVGAGAAVAASPPLGSTRDRTVADGLRRRGRPAPLTAAAATTGTTNAAGCGTFYRATHPRGLGEEQTRRTKTLSPRAVSLGRPSRRPLSATSPAAASPRGQRSLQCRPREAHDGALLHRGTCSEPHHHHICGACGQSALRLKPVLRRADRRRPVYSRANGRAVGHGHAVRERGIFHHDNRSRHSPSGSTRGSPLQSEQHPWSGRRTSRSPFAPLGRRRGGGASNTYARTVRPADWWRARLPSTIRSDARRHWRRRRLGCRTSRSTAAARPWTSPGTRQASTLEAWVKTGRKARGQYSAAGSADEPAGSITATTQKLSALDSAHKQATSQPHPRTL